MKKYIFIILSVLLLGCDKMEDNVFSENPDDRLQKTEEEYRQTILAAPNGWFLAINTKKEGAYRFWMSFTEEGKVAMLADMDATYSGIGETSLVPSGSTWQLKALLAPSLIFETYSYLHLLADPDNNIIGGTKGEGLGSDFEFRIVSEDNGGLNLKGNFNNCLARMDPATPEQTVKASEGGLKTVLEKHADYLEAVRFPTIEVGETKYLVKPNTRKTDFAYIDKENNLVEKTVGSYLDFNSLTQEAFASDVHFFEPVELDGMTFKGLKWNGEAYQVEIEGKTYEIFDNKVPPYPLHFGYNQTFSQLYVNANTMQGTLSDSFMNELYTPAYNRLGERSRYIQEMYCKFVMDALSGKPVMEFGVTYENKSNGKTFTAKWRYPYDVNEDGTLTFTDREQTGSTNEFIYEEYIYELPDLFCGLEYSNYGDADNWSQVVKSKIIPHTFKVDWAENKTPGLSGNIGGLFRVEREELFIAGQLKQ